MSTINFTDSELTLMRMHYQQEYNNTLKKLDELATILNKLGVANRNTPLVKVAATPAAAQVVEDTVASTPITPGKRGRKPKAAGTTASAIVINTPKKIDPLKKGKKISWAKFVVRELKSSSTPMSAPELLQAGSDQFGITDANRNKAMQALQATLYRLSKKSDTLGSEKKKGSYVGYFLNKK